MKKVLAIALLVLLVTGGTVKESEAQFAVFDAVHTAQTILNWITMIEQALIQLEMLWHMVENFENLDIFTWRDLWTLHARLNAILVQGKALVVSSDVLQDEWKELISDVLDPVLPTDFSGGGWDELWTIRAEAELDTYEGLAFGFRNHTTEIVAGAETYEILQEAIQFAEGHEQTLQAMGQMVAYQAEQLAGIRHAVAMVGNELVVADGMKRSAEIGAVVTVLEWLETAGSPGGFATTPL